MRIVKLNRYLTDKVRERILSAQLLRSGTSIGANVCEAGYAQSKRDFVSKMSIALKEAAETEYWLELLLEGEFVTQTQVESLRADCVELVKMLTATINMTKLRIFLEEKI